MTTQFLFYLFGITENMNGDTVFNISTFHYICHIFMYSSITCGHQLQFNSNK